MSEYIIEWSGIGARIVELIGSETPCLVVKRLRKERLREPIVRCRDCVKWHHIDTLDGVRYGECDEWKRADSYCVPATRENGFCAWATCKCGEDIETNGCEWVVCPSCGRVITE